MSKFEQVMSENLGATFLDADFVGKTVAVLEPHGFTADNAIACVATCRDEICRPVRQHIQTAWGEAFNLSSLAGMLTLGRTGFGAFHGHAPTTYSRRQHVYFGMPHIGIGTDGTIGKVERSGMSEQSLACGALFALAAQASEGPLPTEIDLRDAEQSILRKRLAPGIEAGKGDGPIALVELTAQAICADFEEQIAASVDTSEVDYALFIGIQIHGPDRSDYIAPRTSYAVVGGVRHELDLNK